MMLLLALFACDGSGGSCAEKSVDECSSDPSCTALAAIEIVAATSDAGEECFTYGTSATVACSDAGSCFTYNGYARDPSSGSCWYFPYGCGPSNWEVCDPFEVAPEECG